MTEEQFQESNQNIIAHKRQYENCKICDDISSGFHYGIFTCEGCKVN